MEDWVTGVIFALFIIVPCWLALSRREETIRQVEAWPELARRTGLAYEPVTKLWESWASPVSPPGVRGEYRGRSLVVKIIHDSERFEPPNTLISLNVRNYARFSLSIQAKEFRDYIRKITDVSSGNLGFDRLFNITGSPREYIQGAVDLVIQSNPRLLAWIMRNFPSIELKGDNLTCWQNGELTNVEDQIALLDLLCSMAELAEKDPTEVPQGNTE